VTDSPNFGGAVLLTWSDGVLIQHAVKTSPPAAGAAVTLAGIKNPLYRLAPGDTLDGSAAQPIHLVRAPPANLRAWFQASIEKGKFVWTNGKKPVRARKVKSGTEPGSV
jgi:hypothetical protein